MAKAYRCDFCEQAYDGEPFEKVPETWSIGGTHIERTFGLNLSFTVEIKSLNADLCQNCTASIVVEGLQNILSPMRAALAPQEGAQG